MIVPFNALMWLAAGVSDISCITQMTLRTVDRVIGSVRVAFPRRHFSMSIGWVQTRGTVHT